MTGNEYVPTLAEIWDFLVGFKQATEAGFARVDARLDRVEGRLDRVEGRLDVLAKDVTRLDSSIQNLERRVMRLDDRLSAIESQNVTARLADHERRIVALESRYA